MQSIKIRQYNFSIRAPFAEGHPLTEAEAQALNGLRAENIRNNTSKLVIDAVATLLPGELLSQDAQRRLQQRIDAYDASYEFVLKHTPARALGPIDALAMEIAESELAANEALTGEAFATDARIARLRDIAASDGVQAMARRRLEIQQAQASLALAELL